MALFDVYVKVDFEDAGPSVATRRYLLRTQLEDDGSNADDVLTAAAALVTALDVLTWDHIVSHTIEVQIVDTGAAANIAANNNVEAFSRYKTSAGKLRHFSVPAWDDDTFDKAPNGLLSAAYNTAAAAVALLLRDIDSGANMPSPDYSQSRGIKRGQRLVRDA